MIRKRAKTTASLTQTKGTQSSLQRQDVSASASALRETYHHGDLRAALIRAADKLVSEKGVEGFSLRAVARGAGVSPAAPQHHFSNSRSLLTEIAILAYERADEYLRQADVEGSPAKRLRSLAMAFVRFACAYPGHFRLMFRNDLIDRSEPRLSAASRIPGTRLRDAALAYRARGRETSFSELDEGSAVLRELASLNGLAHLVLDDKASHHFAGATGKNFTDEYLPAVLERFYPEA